MSAMRRLLSRRAGARGSDGPSMLILTPMKDAIFDLGTYFEQLVALTYPHDRISLGFLESDSSDGTYEHLLCCAPKLRKEFRSVRVWKRDFGFAIPFGVHRSEPSLKLERRSVLARSRNHLLFHALDDQDWVLWIDVDVDDYPADLIERLLETGREIVHPNCVLDYGGPSFDTNAWRDKGRLHLDDLRDEGDLVELDAVGGTVLFVRADLHRDGLIFPPFPYGVRNDRIRDGEMEVETEGLGIMARDMGHIPWGMPHLEVRHRRH